MDHSIKQNQIIRIIGKIMAKEILRKFDFNKKKLFPAVFTGQNRAAHR